MVKSRIFLLLFNLVALKRTVGASSQDSPRGHYESARLSKEYLRDVARRDFGTMVKLKNLTDSNHPLSPSLLNIAKRWRYSKNCSSNGMHISDPSVLT